MIEIVGSMDGAERQAAEHLAEVISPALPVESKVLIVVGARCFKAKVQDIDLLLFGTLGNGLSVGSGRDQITIRDVAVIVEVKDLPPHRIQSSGQTILGEYDGTWKDISGQAFQQSKSLAQYIKNQLKLEIWVESLIWLRNFEGSVPTSISNVLGRGMTAALFFQTLLRVKSAGSDGGRRYIQFGSDDASIEKLQAIQRLRGFFGQTISPTKVDRKRWEAIVNDKIDKQQYANEKLGTQLLVVKGRAGSGKTAHLIRFARYLYLRSNKVLLLTYNRALRDDLERLFLINNIRDSREEGVHLSTAHKFFIDIVTLFDYWDRTLPFAEAYEKGKKELCDLLEAVNEPPESLKEQPSFLAHPDLLGWDFIFIDEAQDWPEDERDLLFRLFGREKIVIADGLDQLSRGRVRCDWTSSSPKKQFIYLNKALRMGRGLFRFVQAFAKLRNIDWEQEVVEENYSGEITVVHGPYTKQVHQNIMTRHQAEGNQPVDSLFCVPSKRANNKPFAGVLQSWGGDVWDGTSTEWDRLPPTSWKQHRVVHYESCRGLEGWTVVCLQLDRHLHEHFERAKQEGPSDLLQSPEEYGRHQATLHALIPLTRAINHLVIQVDGQGELYRVCHKLHKELPDTITWINTHSA